MLLGRYRIVRKLGEGGMGAIYEAEHELIGRKLAVKCLHKQFSQDSEVVERFKREARAATMIGNEHIIDVTDMGEFADSTPFIVMEYLDGREFAEVIEKDGPLSIGRTVHIITQVCDALAAAHTKGIVHRDLKPENIFLVSRRGRADFVKVLDFGVSKIRESAEKIQGSLTRTGITMGTPHYMSPEQAQGLRDTDHRTDLYALGVITYLALTGEVPFDGDTLPALMVKVMTSEPMPMGAYRMDIPEGLEDIVQKMLCKRAADRFSSAEEVASALQVYAHLGDPPVLGRDSSLPPARPHVPRSVRPPFHGVRAGKEVSRIRSVTAFMPTRKRVAWIGAFALVTAVLTFLIFDQLSSSRSAIQPRTSANSIQASPKKARPAGPKEVRVRIRALPEHAKIFIAGRRFPNPLDAYRPRSLDPQDVKVVSDGFQPAEHVAIFDQDREMVIELKPIVAESSSRRSSSHRHSRRSENKNSDNSKSSSATKHEAQTEPKSSSRFREDF